MLPLDMFRSRGFTAANAVSFLMYFGMFGSVFLLVQFFQLVQGLTPFQAGLRTLPWTAMPIFVAPAAGLVVRADRRAADHPRRHDPDDARSRVDRRRSSRSTVEYALLVPGFILSGVGMGLFFAPIANVVLSAVRHEEEGKASGANNAIREVGGVFGVAVLAAVFSSRGSYISPQAYVDGLVPAIWVGVVFVALGAVAAIAIPRGLGIYQQLREGPEAAAAFGLTELEPALVTADD